MIAAVLIAVILVGLHFGVRALRRDIEGLMAWSPDELRADPNATELADLLHPQHNGDPT